MPQYKIFQTRQEMELWCAAHSDTFSIIEQISLDNGEYAVEYSRRPVQ